MDEDEAVERMRAADPAAGARPDADRLAELTAQRRGDELAARPERRAPRWAAGAAVAAGAVVLGGAAGYGLGRAGDDPPQTQADVRVEGEAPTIAMRGGSATAESMAATDMAIYPGTGAGRTTFTAQGLSGEAGTGTAWAFDGAATVTAETAARAAEVFGVAGEPRKEGGWVVGPSDGSGPTVHLTTDGTAMLHYNDPALYADLDRISPMPMPEPMDDVVPEGGGSAGSPGEDAVPEPVPEDADAPAEEGSAPEDAAAAVEPGVALPAPPEEPTTVADPATDDATAALHTTLQELGLDPDGAQYEIQSHWSGSAVTAAVAHQVVEGERTGHSWYAEVVDGQVMSFSGPLAPLVSLGQYDLVSPAAAVDRLNDPRFGASPVWRDGIAVLDLDRPTRSWDDPPAAPPAPGDAIAWPVTDVTIVAAEPALTTQHQDDGSVLLLPAYELSDAEGRTWSVVAVADHELAF